MNLSNKLSFLTFLSGGEFYSRKQFQTTICNIFAKYPQFFKENDITFDGCYFGPISSEIIKGLESCLTMQFLEKKFWVFPNEPIHEMLNITPAGLSFITKFLETPFILKSINVDDISIVKIIADSLVFNLFPIDFSVAYSFYLQKIAFKDLFDYEKKATKKIPIESSLKIFPTENQINQVVDFYKSHYREIEVKDVQRNTIDEIHNYFLPYKINIESKEISQRYNYLRLNEEKLNFHKSLLQKYQNKKGNLLNFLSSYNSPSREIGKIREYILNLLQKKYSDLAETFYFEAEAILHDLNENDNFDVIQTEGYDWVINEFIGKLAESSVNAYEEPNYLENMCAVTATSSNPGTNFHIHCPEKIVNDFSGISKGTWNYGMVYHLNHFIQIEPVTLFLLESRQNEIIQT